MLTAKLLSVLLLAAAAAVQATPVMPLNSLVISGGDNGIFAYMYSNSSLVELRSPGTPSQPTPGLSTWAINLNAAGMSALGITNVAPSTKIAGYGYASITSAISMRIFYQTTNGDIVSAFHIGESGLPDWMVDTTIATNVPLGTPITAFVDGTLQVVQYGDATGSLVSRYNVLYTGTDWSAPITVQV